MIHEEVSISISQHIDLNITHNNTHSPHGILHGEEHFDDIGLTEIRNIGRNERDGEQLFPRDKLHRRWLTKVCDGPTIIENKGDFTLSLGNSEQADDK